MGSGEAGVPPQYKSIVFKKLKILVSISSYNQGIVRGGRRGGGSRRCMNVTRDRDRCVDGLEMRGSDLNRHPARSDEAVTAPRAQACDYLLVVGPGHSGSTFRLRFAYPAKIGL